MNIRDGGGSGFGDEGLDPECNNDDNDNIGDKDTDDTLTYGSIKYAKNQKN